MVSINLREECLSIQNTILIVDKKPEIFVYEAHFCVVICRKLL